MTTIDRLHAFFRLAVHLDMALELHDRAFLVDPGRVGLAFPLVAAAVEDHVVGRRDEDRAVLAARARNGPMIWNESLPSASSAFEREVGQRVVRARRPDEGLLVGRWRVIQNTMLSAMPASASSAATSQRRRSIIGVPSSRERGELGLGLALRGEDQIADFARRARRRPRGACASAPARAPTDARWRRPPRIRRAA